MAFWSAKSKTVRIPEGNHWTVQDFKKAAGIKGLETHLQDFYVTVQAGEPPSEYRIHHVHNALLGWNIEIIHPQDDTIDLLVGALVYFTGARPEHRPTGNNNVKTTISPRGKIGLGDMVHFLEAYESQGLKNPRITGLTADNVPTSTYKAMEAAGLKVQEIKP